MPQIGFEFGGRNNLEGYAAKECALRQEGGSVSNLRRAALWETPRRELMIATGLQNGNDHQVRIGE
jgi:hypothetical protein